MKRQFPVEFVYQVFALLIAVILVHAVYVAVGFSNQQDFLMSKVEEMGGGFLNSAFVVEPEPVRR